MEKQISGIGFLWVGVALIGGCFDLELLDDMVPIEDTASDGDSAAIQGANGTEGGATAGEAEGVSSPTTPQADASDTDAPTITAGSCPAPGQGEDGFCIVKGAASASIRFVTDEPAAITAGADVGLAVGVLSSEWEVAHRVVVGGLSSEAAEVTVAVSDVNGNRREQRVSLAGGDGEPVVITEVAADPVGPEPAQEYVEVMNVGGAPVDVSGWMVDDNGDADGDLIPPGTVLAPGAVGLLVSPSFDTASAVDPAPAPDAVLIRLESSIGSNGLKNGEAESVELYNGAGTLVSRYSGEAGAPREGLTAHRLLAEVPFGDPGAFLSDPTEGDPGAASCLDSVSK